MEDIKMLGVLSEKTRADIKIFIDKSPISEDEEGRRKFYDLIQRIVAESYYRLNEKNK